MANLKEKDQHIVYGNQNRLAILDFSNDLLALKVQHFFLQVIFYLENPIIFFFKFFLERRSCRNPCHRFLLQACIILDVSRRYTGIQRSMRRPRLFESC